MKVSDLFGQISARLGEKPAVPFLEAVQTVSETISRHLADIKSELLNKVDDTFTITAGGTETLPDGFAGFTCRPWCVEDRIFIEQVSDEEKLSSTAKRLAFYDLRGTSFSLFPAQTSTRNIKVTYLSQPAPISSLADNVPFAGKFDFLFRELVAQVSTQGLSVLSDPAFERYLEGKVSDVARNRQPVMTTRNGYFD